MPNFDSLCSLFRARTNILRRRATPKAKLPEAPVLVQLQPELLPSTTLMHCAGLCCPHASQERHVPDGIAHKGRQDHCRMQSPVCVVVGHGDQISSVLCSCRAQSNLCVRVPMSLLLILRGFEERHTDFNSCLLLARTSLSRDMVVTHGPQLQMAC